MANVQSLEGHFLHRFGKPTQRIPLTIGITHVSGTMTLDRIEQLFGYLGLSEGIFESVAKRMDSAGL